MRILIIIFLNLLFYWRTLKYYYVCDDVPGVVEDKTEILLYKKIWQELRGQGYYNRIRAHSFTLLFHTIVCVLIYLALGRNNVSFICALLFAVNPSNNQVSIWLSGKPYSPATIGALISYIFPILIPGLWYFASFYICGVTYFFPLVFIRTPYWPCIFLAIIPFLKYKHIVKQRGYEGRNKELTTFKLKKIILFFKSYGYYFVLGLCPFRLGVHHNYLTGISVHPEYDKENYRIDKYFWIGVIVLYVLVTNFIWNWSPTVFGLLWFSICIAQFCNLVSLQMTIAERYLYLANIGLMYMLAQMIMGVVYPFNAFIFLVIFTAYSIRLLLYMPSYKNDFFQIEYNLIEQWDNIRARLFRARMKFRQNEFMGAYLEYMVLYKLYPWDFKVLYNLSMMSLAIGNLKGAEDFISEAERNIYKNEDSARARQLIAEVRTTIEDTQKNNGVAVNRLNVLV